MLERKKEKVEAEAGLFKLVAGKNNGPQEIFNQLRKNPGELGKILALTTLGVAALQDKHFEAALVEAALDRVDVSQMVTPEDLFKALAFAIVVVVTEQILDNK